MLNYIKSELYRASKNAKLYGFIGAVLALMLLLLGALNYYKQDPTFPYANLNFALGSISIQMNYLIVIAVAFTGLIYDNEDKQHTIKHAVAFGIKRSTIYLSRFLTTVLISSLIYLILVTGYTVVARLLLPPLTGDEIRQLIIVSIGSMTCLYAAIAVAQCFFMVMENQTLAYIYSLLIIVALPILLTNAGRKITFLGELAKGFIYHAISPAGPLVVAGEGQLGGVLFCLGVGAIWMVLFTAIGINRFSRLEIK